MYVEAFLFFPLFGINNIPLGQSLALELGLYIQTVAIYTLLAKVYFPLRYYAVEHCPKFSNHYAPTRLSHE